MDSSFYQFLEDYTVICDWLNAVQIERGKCTDVETLSELVWVYKIDKSMDMFFNVWIYREMSFYENNPGEIKSMKVPIFWSRGKNFEIVLKICDCFLYFFVIFIIILFQLSIFKWRMWLENETPQFTMGCIRTNFTTSKFSCFTDRDGI